MISFLQLSSTYSLRMRLMKNAKKAAQNKRSICFTWNINLDASSRGYLLLHERSLIFRWFSHNRIMGSQRHHCSLKPHKAKRFIQTRVALLDWEYLLENSISIKDVDSLTFLQERRFHKAIMFVIKADPYIFLRSKSTGTSLLNNCWSSKSRSPSW